MTNRERTMNILNYKPVDRMPIVAFGYWNETLEKWYHEGHITEQNWRGYWDNSPDDFEIMKKLGFDFDWSSGFGSNCLLNPPFEKKILEEMPNGQMKCIDDLGLIVIEKKDVVSIPAEVGHLLTDRKAWEELYLPKLQWSEDRINFEELEKLKAVDEKDREFPLGIYCGSLFGNIRNILGVEGISYLYADDEDLYVEIINTVADICYKNVERILQEGIKFDMGQFWEDICFKNGPLVIPRVFDELVGPHYKRITDLLKKYDVNIVSLDCDGMIDSLIPTWINNGVNTMFPIEVGTWNASIAPWREKYGKELRGVGGMDKKVFAQDYKAIDKEIERLKPLIALGGFIPCPDHRIPPDAKWENVQYYCEKLKEVKI